MRKAILRQLIIALALLALWVAPCAAQDSQTSTAPQTSAEEPQGNAPQSNQGQPSTSAPMTPLSGVQVLAPTFGTTALSYVVPAAACTERATTNPSGYHYGSVYSQTSCAGQVTLQKVGRHSQFNLDYTAGGYYYNRSISEGNLTDIKNYGVAQQLGFTEEISGARWSWLIGDQGTYLPEGPGGYQGFAGLASFGGGMGGSSISSAPALGNAFSPNQSLFGGLARRLSDMAETEVNYRASARSTLTGSVVYGTLQFLTPGFVDDRYWMATGGYNRTVGRADELAITYDEMHFNFGANQNMVSRGASILYGHQLSPRFTVELSVAPADRELSLPGISSSGEFFMGTYDALKYRGARWNGTLSVGRNLGGGAGVMAGAERTTVMGSLGRQLTRHWRGDFRGSYNNNRGFQPVASTAAAPSYDYLQAGVGLNRELGPHVSMYLDYNVDRQTGNRNICVGGNCQGVYFRQTGGFGISWHARPIKIE